MRIRDFLAAAGGVSACSVEDFYFVGSKVSIDPSRLVLVGGQAIEAWGHYFGVAAPSGDSSPLTQDIDWFGTKNSAEWLCGLLGKESTHLKVADNFDPSPNSAVALHKRPDGRVVLLDFLKSLVGISPDLVASRAVRVHVGPVTLYILHPLLCLESRLANLHKLPSKRNGNGKLQAKWAVQIVAAYIRQLVELKAPAREVIKACHELAEMTEYRSGPYCFDEFQIDPLEAMSPELLQEIGGLFAKEDWPRRVARIEMKRAQRLRHLLKRQQLVKYSFTLTSGAPQRSEKNK